MPFEVFPTSTKIEIDPKEFVSRIPENHKKFKLLKFQKNLIFILKIDKKIKISVFKIKNI